MIEQRPFSAASSKLAYAQAFAGPIARRAAGRTAQRRHLQLSWLQVARRRQVGLAEPTVRPQS